MHRFLMLCFIFYNMINILKTEIVIFDKLMNDSIIYDHLKRN